jgi:hypothetical protein
VSLVVARGAAVRVGVVAAGIREETRMAHGTGMFKQREFLEKLRRLEQEVASAKAAAEEMARKAVERSAQNSVKDQTAAPEGSTSETKAKA